MGGLLSTSGQPQGPNAKILQDISCPKCGKIFTKHNSYSQFYNHEKFCKEKPNFPKKYKNSTNIDKNDKEIIKSIITENRKKLSIKESTKLIQNDVGKIKLPLEENLNYNTSPLQQEKNKNIHNNNNNNNISRPQNKKHTHYFSSQNNRLNPFYSSNFNQELVLSGEDNLNINISISKNLIKNNNKKYSISNKSISDLNSSYLKDFPFEEKLAQFKKHIQLLKIDWREGACTLNLDRDDIIAQSMEQFNQIDPYKELKINFKGEVSHDAGGLIREWFTVVFKELQKENMELFERSDTSDFSYKIHKNAQCTIQNLDVFNFIGKILAKALLDNLTINSCFNKLIFKIILDEQVNLDDLVFIDKPLYHSLKELKKLKNVDELSLYFVVQYELQGEIISDELIINGNNVLVTNDNLDDYIDKRHLECKEKIFTNEIRTGIFSVIPEKLLKIFNCDEFELLINGTPFIDVYDWKMNTIYKGYKENSQVVANFWNYLHGKSQDDLMRFLQFCTGSSRVPVGGFSVLESNRGNISKFCITRTEYYKNSKNFLKAHTCFNRIDVPDFPNKSLLEESVSFIVNNEILGFGID